jgi:hypothetical protein
VIVKISAPKLLHIHKRPGKKFRLQVNGTLEGFCVYITHRQMVLHTASHSAAAKWLWLFEDLWSFLFTIVSPFYLTALYWHIQAQQYIFDLYSGGASFKIPARKPLFIVYIYIYTGCPRRNVPDFGRVFLMLKYTNITQNTCDQS